MSALISHCGRYRYWLLRRWSAGTSQLAVVMLNPSTADALLDDATIRALTAYATKWGYGGLVVMNAYAYRATNPKALLKTEDPVGAENNWHLQSLADSRSEIVVAWGANIAFERQTEVGKILRSKGAKLLCFGINKNGSPKHPLYIKRDTELTEWTC